MAYKSIVIVKIESHRFFYLNALSENWNKTDTSDKREGERRKKTR